MIPMILRPYQQAAVDATLAYFRKQAEPAVIVLPTGAGKSLVIAELPRLARGRVLVLAHVKELVEQNHAKYLALGFQAGIFSAGLERRDNLQHAKKIVALLPVNRAVLITSETSATERTRLITGFKNQQFIFLVNVAVLTTGFDAPHVDLIAILRPTESASLYQQMVGRGLRLSEHKKECLILDYAGNPHDLYSPEPSGVKSKKDHQPVQVFCPECGFANTFWGKTGEDGTILEHFGRRCQAWYEDNDGLRHQCHYRFRFKNCPHCQAENDIAARCCCQCNHILVDADDRLKSALALKGTKIIRCSGMTFQQGSDVKGSWLKITYYDEDGATLSERFRFHTPAHRRMFEQLFIHPHIRALGIPLNWATLTDIIDQQALFRYPDFVIARKNGQFWRIREKIFDYQGRYRLANQLRG